MASNAASRVFAVPELLEHILLYYSHSDAKITTAGHIKEPSLGLFAIQRTCRDFQATIQGSKLLRRLMFLEPVDFSILSEEETDNYHYPLWWFLEEMEFEVSYWDSSEVDETRESFLELPNLSVNDFRLLAQKFFGPTSKRADSAWLRSEASWRQIKVCNSTAPKPIDIEMAYCPTDHPSIPVCTTWEIGGEDTLESVFNEFEAAVRAVAAEERRYQRYKQKGIRRNKKRTLRGKMEYFDSELEDEQHDCVLDDLIRGRLGCEDIQAGAGRSNGPKRVPAAFAQTMIQAIHDKRAGRAWLYSDCELCGVTIEAFTLTSLARALPPSRLHMFLQLRAPLEFWTALETQHNIRFESTPPPLTDGRRQERYMIRYFSIYKQAAKFYQDIMSSSAGSRLTATTELLEEILFLAVCNGNSIRGNGHNYRPVYKLFALQRVSLDFQHTIAGSKKLRRLMFYGPIEASTFRATFSHHAPTRWLLDDMLRPGIFKTCFKPQHHAHATIELNLLPLRDPNAKNSSKWRPADPGWTHPEASWRNIKICNAKEGMVPIIVIAKVGYYGGWRSGKVLELANEKGIPNIISVRWNFEGDDTLGQLFDRFSEFMRVLIDAWQVDAVTRARRIKDKSLYDDADEEDHKHELKIWKQLEKLSDPPRPGPEVTDEGNI
ncbi:hypothetical protein HII31_07054 [Pseudocercospora fuligena]|uniref:Uncharacterized protein n=1 Tax=Pseudocercospora fuligena TaxID=685502 RepID=A0A8H6RIP4_9PEZI|nr:hypothetical protein HII31_07054 [Pseudocercospora fuligena]